MEQVTIEIATLKTLQRIEDTLTNIHKELTKHSEPTTYNVTVNSKEDSKTDIDKVIKSVNDKLQASGYFSRSSLKY